jgi:hypothetical protein
MKRPRCWRPLGSLGHTVDGARVGPGHFDAMVHLVGGGELFVRVQTQLETGPRLVLTMEPVHP